MGVVATASGDNAIGDNMPGPSSCNDGAGCRYMLLQAVAVALATSTVAVAIAMPAALATSDGVVIEDFIGVTAAPLAFASGLSNIDGIVLIPATIAVVAAATDAAAFVAVAIVIVGGGISTSTFTYVRL